MSLSELIAPFVALPLAGVLLWLAFGDLFSKGRRAAMLNEWKRSPLSHLFIYAGGVSLAIFLVWIGTHGHVGNGHFGWIAFASLLVGFALHPRERRR